MFSYQIDKSKQVWAIACQLNSNMTRCMELQKPELGQIVGKKFFPFSKTGVLSTTRSVQDFRRRYAYTEEEATELYNQEVDQEIADVNYHRP